MCFAFQGGLALSRQEADRELSGEPFMAGCGGYQVILEF